MPEISAELLQEHLLPILKGLGGAILLIALVVIAYRLMVRGLDLLKAQERLSPHITVVLQRVLRWVAVVVAVLIVLQSFDFLQNVWTLLSTVLALVAIGFVAVWSVLSNVLCSVMLLIVRPFQVGDVIELSGQDTKGKVVNFNLLFTILRGEDGDLVQIPNNVFFQTPIRRRLGETTVNLEEQLHKEDNTE